MSTTRGSDSGNSRNGTRAKTVLTENGPVEVEFPRCRGASLDPQLVRERQPRLAGFDEIVLSLTAHGLATRRGALPRGFPVLRRGGRERARAGHKVKGTSAPHQTCDERSSRAETTAIHRSARAAAVSSTRPVIAVTRSIRARKVLRWTPSSSAAGCQRPRWLR